MCIRDRYRKEQHWTGTPADPSRRVRNQTKIFWTMGGRHAMPCHGSRQDEGVQAGKKIRGGEVDGVRCHVMSCMSCPCHVMSMSCHVHVMSCDGMSCPCHVMLWHAMSCHVMHVMSCTPCHVMPCHVHAHFMSMSCPCP